MTVTSCGTPPSDVPRVRFANAPPVTVVDDRRPVAERPDVSPSLLDLDYYDRAVAGPILGRLSLPDHRRARGVNAIDEVPDSTWFTNRIGVRDLSVEEIVRGPGDDEGPEAHKPWLIRSTKSGGTETGYIITDARGIKYGISFDTLEWPELETGAAAVVNRLVWAFGYNVPDDRVAYVRPEELVLAADARVKDSQGRKVRRLDRKALDRQLARVWKTPDGRIRVLASRWLGGESLGGTPPAGVRRGDPNDRIPHEDRRDLRGQYPLFAWLQHVDLVQANFLDMLIAAAGDPPRRYVVHYLLDFGRSLGTEEVIEHNLRSNERYQVDWSDSVLALGLTGRPWGHDWAPALPGVAPGFVPAFDPGAWRPSLPYAPFDAADRFDMFWGAKVLGRFTRDQIRAAVEAGQFTDRRTVDYLTETLVARQRATLAYWYARVNPLDRFAVRGEGLCFEDLAITARLASPAQTRYELASYDRGERPLGRVVISGVPGAAAICTSSLPRASDRDGYTIVKITTVRTRFTGSTAVHLAREPRTGAWRVIGVWRM